MAVKNEGSDVKLRDPILEFGQCPAVGASLTALRVEG